VLKTFETFETFEVFEGFEGFEGFMLLPFVIFERGSNTIINSKFQFFNRHLKKR
jgi:hypothetical protein